MRLGFCHLSTPAQHLVIEIIKVTELSPWEKIGLHVVKRPFNPTFSIRMIQPVGAELEAERAGKCRHLRRNDGIGTRTSRENDAAIIDDTRTGRAIHKACRLEQKVLGLKPGEPLKVLHEQPPRVGQHQACALRGNHAAVDHHAMR